MVSTCISIWTVPKSTGQHLKFFQNSSWARQFCMPNLPNLAKFKCPLNVIKINFKKNFSLEHIISILRTSWALCDVFGVKNKHFSKIRQNSRGVSEKNKSEIFLLFLKQETTIKISKILHAFNYCLSFKFRECRDVE